MKHTNLWLVVLADDGGHAEYLVVTDDIETAIHIAAQQHGYYDRVQRTEFKGKVLVPEVQV